MAVINKQDIIAWLEKLGAVFDENRIYLTDLDAAIGDADHGINMARGFTKVMEKLPTMREKDISGILKDVGMTLVSTVGGASGPLYGTFFMRAGGAVGGQTSLDGDAVQQMFIAGRDGVQQRGKAQIEDKTMLDAMTPAVEALQTALAEGASLKAALQKATDAAEAGMKATVPIVARKGRASYLGERSRGHQDPGATSTYLLFKAASDTWQPQ